MKTIIVLISLVSSLTYAYQDFDTITEVSHTIAQIASVDANIASVKLNDSGVMTITKRDRTSKTLKLSEVNMQDLLWSAQMLSEAELVTDTHTVVCKMMITPFSIQNLTIYDSKTRSMKLVLSASSCALTSFTHPKEDYALEAARTLKAQMLVLAQQLAN